MSSNLKNEDTAKSDCFCDLYAFWGANATHFYERGAGFKRLGTYALF